jgi:hypothetical protein
VAQGPQGWIDLKPAFRDDFTRREIGFISAEDPAPWPLVVLRILGFGALVSFPVVTTILLASLEHYFPYAPAWQWLWLPLFGPCTLLLAFIFLGAGYRAAGGVVRGALAGAGLYLALGAAFLAYLALRFGPPSDLIAMGIFGMAWPLMSLKLLGFFGGFG